MTPQEIYDSMERGWEKLGWVQGKLMDKPAPMPAVDKQWLNEFGMEPFVPTCACAMGALMYDQHISEIKAYALVSNTGHLGDHVVYLNDNSRTLKEAKKRIKEYLLS